MQTPTHSYRMCEHKGEGHQGTAVCQTVLRRPVSPYNLIQMKAEADYPELFSYS